MTAACGVVACVLVAVVGTCGAQTPYALDSGPDVERGAAEPAVEREVARTAAPVVDDGASSEVAQALQQLDAAEWIDRLTGVYALQRMGTDAAPAAARLAAALGDENGSVRFEAAEALFRIGGPAVPFLVATLTSRDEETRAQAVRTLGRVGLGARDAVPALEGLRADPAPAVAEQVAFALPMIAPQGVGDWLRKIGFEIGDEPWGVPGLLGAFVALVVARSLWGLRRNARSRADAGARPPAEPSVEARHDDERDDDERDDDERDDEEEDERDDDGPATVDRRRGREDDDDPLQPTQGLPHAIAGLVAMGVAALVAFLGTLKDVPDERHGVWHFAALFFLFGWLFFRVGLKGEWLARRARARRDANAERWLRDRAWDRDGTGPVRAERVAPSLLALVLWIGFLLPFHTVWALPWSYWGVWIVLGLFDLIGVAIAVATVRRIWWRLRSGRCRLRWQGAPVRPGGTFTARFETARALGGDAQLAATLRCLRDRRENRVIGEEAAADAEEVWTETRSFPVHDRPEGGSWVQLAFPVPARLPGTDSYAARPVRWVVTVSLSIAGPDFRTTFPVPIYR